MHLSPQQLRSTLLQVFRHYGFDEPKATLLANTFTDSTLMGVQSHGINRVPVFIDYVKKGLVKVEAEAECIGAFGSMERWDGHLGPGILNATQCTSRAIALTKTHGMGLVALRNTNHWMRGGTYGQQAAEAGCIGIMFTNTTPNMPPWGGKDSRLGNNPLIVAIPRPEGQIVLDMAMSQFSFGKIHQYHLRGEQLPFAGGWDSRNRPTTDPDEILATDRALPIGYWKGSALSLILDMLVTMLSAGNSTGKIGEKPAETAISQVFLCIDTQQFGDEDLQQRLLQDIIDYTHQAEPLKPGDSTRYPGERSAETYVRSLREGVTVDDGIWNTVLGLIN